MKVITIINTLAIIYIFVHKLFTVSKCTTYKNTLLGYEFYFKGNRFIYLPIRNADKTELNEELHDLITASQQAKKQQLYAKFSWLKTVAEVEQFKKDYEVVDRKLVNDLETEFRLINKH